LLTADGPRLAPFYDLICTAVYPEISERLAMRIGGEDRPGWIIERRWAAFADDVGIKAKLVRDNLLALGAQLIEQSRILAGEFQRAHGACPLIDAIQAIIQERVRKTRLLFEAEGEVPQDLS